MKVSAMSKSTSGRSGASGCVWMRPYTELATADVAAWGKSSPCSNAVTPAKGNNTACTRMMCLTNDSVAECCGCLEVKPQQDIQEGDVERATADPSRVGQQRAL